MCWTYLYSFFFVIRNLKVAIISFSCILIVRAHVLFESELLSISKVDLKISTLACLDKTHLFKSFISLVCFDFRDQIWIQSSQFAEGRTISPWFVFSYYYIIIMFNCFILVFVLLVMITIVCSSPKYKYKTLWLFFEVN